MNDSEGALLRRAQQGDRRACEQLFRQFVEPIFATAYRLTGNTADAEDLSQETFVRAFQAMGNFQRRSAFHTWLYRILLNVAHDHFRKKAKEPGGPNVELAVEAGKAQNARTTGLNDDPPQAAVEREEREMLRAALRELPENQRVALSLVYLEGMSCREVAEAMDSREGTVYWWVHEAKRRLARRLAPKLDPGGAG